MSLPGIPRLRLVILYYVGGISFVLGTVGCTLIALVLQPWLRSPAGRRRFRVALHRFVRSWFTFLHVLRVARVSFPEARPITGGEACVIACPHFSLLDALMVFAAYPDTVCVFKKALVQHPLFGPLARACGHLGNHSGRRLFHDAREAVREGANVLFFPEGTRRRGDACGPLHSGFLVAARHAGAPIRVLPLVLPRGLLDKDHKPWLPPPGVAPVTLAVKAGPVFQVESRQGDDDLLARVEAAFERHRS